MNNLNLVQAFDLTLKIFDYLRNLDGHRQVDSQPQGHFKLNLKSGSLNIRGSRPGVPGRPACPPLGTVPPGPHPRVSSYIQWAPCGFENTEKKIPCSNGRLTRGESRVNNLNLVQAFDLTLTREDFRLSSES